MRTPCLAPGKGASQTGGADVCKGLRAQKGMVCVVGRNRGMQDPEDRQCHFTRVSVPALEQITINGHGLGGLNNRNSFSPGGGGWEV